MRSRQKRSELGLFGRSSSRDVQSDVVISEVSTPTEEASPLPLPSEPPPEWKYSSDTDATILAAVHPYGHEQPVKTSRTEFESIVRDGFYLEGDTMEEPLLDEVVEGVNRELDPMKSFPVYQAVRIRREKPGPHDCGTQENGTQASKSVIRGEAVRKLPGCKLLRSHSSS